VSAAELQPFLIFSERFNTAMDSTTQRAVRKTPLLSHLYTKTIILPRQARDKHRQVEKKPAFFTGGRGWAA
jgi:hypothetical protein